MWGICCGVVNPGAVAEASAMDSLRGGCLSDRRHGDDIHGLARLGTCGGSADFGRGVRVCRIDLWWRCAGSRARKVHGSVDSRTGYGGLAVTAHSAWFRGDARVRVFVAWIVIHNLNGATCEHDRCGLDVQG